MWAIRFVLLGFLIALVSASGYFLSHRKEYQELLENKVFNLAVVIVYNLICYLMTSLPSDQNVISPPVFFLHPGVRLGSSVVGWVMIGVAVLIMGMAMRQRKTVGGQNVKEGLLTSGVYRYSRHPIYAGVIGVSLGVALITLSWDGLLMVPAVALVNAGEAVIEERYDIGKRSPLQYQEYRKRTRMFGPVWVWAVPLGCLLVLAMIPSLG